MGVQSQDFRLGSVDGTPEPDRVVTRARRDELAGGANRNHSDLLGMTGHGPRVVAIRNVHISGFDRHRRR